MEGFNIAKDGKHLKCLLAGSKSNEEERIKRKRKREGIAEASSRGEVKRMQSSDSRRRDGI